MHTYILMIVKPNPPQPALCSSSLPAADCQLVLVALPSEYIQHPITLTTTTAHASPVPSPLTWALLSSELVSLLSPLPLRSFSIATRAILFKPKSDQITFPL